jgi:hypothetical protein
MKAMGWLVIVSSLVFNPFFAPFAQALKLAKADIQAPFDAEMSCSFAPNGGAAQQIDIKRDGEPGSYSAELPKGALVAYRATPVGGKIVHLLETKIGDIAVYDAQVFAPGEEVDDEGRPLRLSFHGAVLGPSNKLDCTVSAIL